MSTSFRSGYVRGVQALLLADDSVDAGAVSDVLIANAQHLFDAHHSHIANVVTPSGGTAAVRHTDPSDDYYVLAARWPFEPIEQADGGSAKVVYRIGFRRSGGSGSITIGVRIGVASTVSSDWFMDGISAYQNTHTTTLTTTSTVRGTLYVPSVLLDVRHPLAVGPRGALARLAFFEVWCMHSGSKPTVELTSVMARQYLRVTGGDENAVLREDSSYVLREDGSYVLRE